MFKYVGWLIKAGIPIVWNYFTWMRRWAKHPERYSQQARFERGRQVALKLLKRLKVDVEIRNAPLLKGDEVYYFVGNHTSLMDAVVTLAYLPVPVYYISKIETRKMPFASTMFKIVGGALIERDNLKQEIKVMQQMRESLAKKETSWLIFPEGTRKKDYHTPLLEYKAGAFKAPVQAQTTIIPFVLWGNQLILNPKTRAKRYKVVLAYLEPVLPTGTTGEIAEHILNESNRMAETLKVEYYNTQKLNRYGRKLITPPTHTD